MTQLDASKIKTYQWTPGGQLTVPGPMTTLDPDALYVALDRQRRKSRMRWRDVATEAGVSPSTLTRIGQGHRPDADGLVRLLAWLGTTDLAPFVSLAAGPVHGSAPADLADHLHQETPMTARSPARSPLMADGYTPADVRFLADALAANGFMHDGIGDDPDSDFAAVRRVLSALAAAGRLRAVTELPEDAS